MHIDFTQGAIARRRTRLHGTNELIAKAVGWKQNIPLHVFDTTAGLGREAFLLASLGCEVTLFERNPDVALALTQALAQARLDPAVAPTIARMHFHPVCAIAYLQQHPSLCPDVIYCDPMFPTRTKSAAVKKEMQQLQALVGLDKDASELVAIALQRAKKRVVVKRALRAPILIKEPDFQYRARSHRFDVYLA